MVNNLVVIGPISKEDVDIVETALWIMTIPRRIIKIIEIEDSKCNVLITIDPKLQKRFKEEFEEAWFLANQI